MHFASTPPSHERMAIWCVNNTIFPVQAISHQYNDIVIFSKLSSAPPKISRKELSLTPCCYIAFVCLYI